MVLTEWLHTRDVEFDVPRDLRPAVDGAGAEQDLPLLVISSEHRRYASRLARLHPSESRLRAFYERFSEASMGTAGQAMRDWLRVVRLAIDETDPRHVVVIPLLD